MNITRPKLYAFSAPRLNHMHASHGIMDLTSQSTIHKRRPVRCAVVCSYPYSLSQTSPS